MKNAIYALHGAYELAAGGSDPQVTILASGSEVSIAMEARDCAERRQFSARVVSVPCMELFEQQATRQRRLIFWATRPFVSLLRRPFDKAGIASCGHRIFSSAWTVLVPAHRPDSYFSISALPQTQLREAARNAACMDF